MRLQLTDRYALDAKDTRTTRDGYLVAAPRVARTGIQLYAGHEVGRPQMDVVRVYRPPEEVFNKDSMATFAFKPITNDHPKVPVSSKNWKDYSVGLAGGEVARDQEFIRVPMTVMDQSTIDDYKAGKAELSVGYSTELKWGDGVVPDTNEAYDAIQTAITVNHIAIVDAARGGSKLKIGDKTAPDFLGSTVDAATTDEEGTDEMSGTNTTKTTIVVDGFSIPFDDAMTASIVQRSFKAMEDKLASGVADIAKLTAQMTTMKTDSDAALAKAATEAKVALDAANAKVVTLEAQVKDAALSPAKLEAMVKDRAELLGKAKAVLGDKLVVDGKTDAEIRKQVVDAKLGDSAKDWSADQVAVSFATLTADIKPAVASGVQDAAAAFRGQPNGGSQPGNWNNDAKSKTYAERDKKLSEAWKTPNKMAS